MIKSYLVFIILFIYDNCSTLPDQGPIFNNLLSKTLFNFMLNTATNESDFLNDIMGFNPQDMSAFNEPDNTANEDPQVYKTNPVTLSKSEDGHYHAQIRIIYNPFNVKESVIKEVLYTCQDTAGYFKAPSSLAVGNKKCPLFTAWKKLHFAKKPDGSEDTVVKAWGEKMYSKRENRWVLVQIIEDDNQPELIGQIKAWKLPKSVWNKMEAKMNPSPDSKKTPVALMDYLFGPILTLDVAPGPDDAQHPERKQREISYDTCEFESDAYPILQINAEGETENLFTDEELETIDTYANAKSAYLKAVADTKSKTAAKKAEDAKATMDGLTEEIKKLYVKAIRYMKENAFDIHEKYLFKPWDEELTKRVQNWIDKVAKMQDPASGPTLFDQGAPAAALETVAAPQEDDVFNEVMGDEEDAEGDLPF